MGLAGLLVCNADMNEELNPYSPPAHQPLPPVQDGPIALIPVSGGLRFANYLVDALVAQLGGGFLLGLGVALVLRDKANEFLESGFLTVLSLLVFIAYYIVFEALTGRTLGKLVTGTKVVDASGNKPSFGKIVGRNFARLIPFEAFSFLGSSARGWHDSLSGTYVVKCR
jgi:uncharacterized RDD family membrane protein YckC